MQSFMKKCQEISFKVLSCFALGLGFDEDFFTKVRSSIALDLSRWYICICHCRLHGRYRISDLQARQTHPKMFTITVRAYVT